ncbi:MAG: sugar kinase [Bacilli bacterium]
MKYVTLGEIMLRLSTKGFERFAQAQSFDVNYGGGEANVAVSLANFGEEASFVSKLPLNPLGDCAINSLRQYGVDTSRIIRGGDRLGIYFLETGVSMRPSQVVYDRAHSSIAEADADEFDFEKLFSGCSWLHMTGITPAISQKARILTEKALREAKKIGLTVSFDLNFRKKLWTSQEAQDCLRPLMKYVDYVIGNEEDAAKCLGFKLPNDVNSGKLDRNGYETLLRELCSTFGFKGAATSLRESYSASDNGWSGALVTDGKFYLSKHYDIRLVDRVGGGDSFAAGLIYGLSHYDDPQTAIDFAAASSALKQTIPGDYNHVSLNEVVNLMDGDGSGRVQR